jgi:hypothetical protein
MTDIMFCFFRMDNIPFDGNEKLSAMMFILYQEIITGFHLVNNDQID